MPPRPEPAAETTSGPHLAAAGLATRWLQARRAALRTVVPQAEADASEEHLRALAWTIDPEAALRRVFDNSHRLGRSFAQWHRVDLTRVDLEGLLPLLGAPCTAQGLCRVDGHLASRAVRAPCAPATTEPGLCTYWREALHGLVSGLSSSVYYTRVESPPASARCVDLLHVDAMSPLRLAAVPGSLEPALERARAKLARIVPGTTVEALGLVDGALHVRIHHPGERCGLDLDRVLRRSLERALPGLTVRDASPRPVLGDPS